MTHPAIRRRARDRSPSKGMVEAVALAALLAVGWQVARRPAPAAPRPVRWDAGASAQAAASPGDPGPLPPREPTGAVDFEKNRRVDEAIRRARLSSVTLEYEPAPGLRHRVASGVVINDQGEILSVRIDPPADRSRPAIAVYDASGHSHRARWLAADPDTGLTLLRVDAADVKPIRLAAGDPSLGAEVFLVGTPFGYGHSVSRGHVADLGRRLPDSLTLSGLILIQAPIRPGDSGAPVADLDGGWIGLLRAASASAEAGRDRGSDLGFAIPARDALWVADQLRANGKVDRAYLGLRFAPDDEVDTRFAPVVAPSDLDAPPAADEAGARVDEVIPGSPAEHSGLRPGDRIVRVDDRPVATTQDLTDRLNRTLAGAEVVLEYVRAAIRKQVALRAVSRPPAPTPAPALGPPPTPRVAPAAPPTLADRPEDSAATIRSLREQLRQSQDQLRQVDRRLRDLESKLDRIDRKPAATPAASARPSGG